MAALTGPRNVEKLSSGDIVPLKSLPVAASTLIYAGAAVCLSGGYLVNASATTGLLAMGVANETVDNSSGSNGDLVCGVDTGVFKMVNNGSNTVAQTNIGADVYFEDNQTVSTNSTGTSVAGKAVSLESDGVYVRISGGL